MTTLEGRMRITSIFGPRVLAGKQEFHYGIDLVNVTGSRNIREVTGGTVTRTSTAYNGGRGWLVEVTTNTGAVQIYQHLSAILVKVGQKVAQGTVVGVMGATGYSFGVHLHFEVKVNGRAVNPSAWLGLPNVAGTYEPNNTIDGKTDPSNPETGPGDGQNPTYPPAMYRVYNSIEAYEDKAPTLESFKAKKQNTPAEFILLSVGDGKWRIAQVYLATQSIDNALANLGRDAIVCGSDMKLYRIYNVSIAKEAKETAEVDFRAVATSAPNEAVLTSIGGDGKWRVANVFVAKASLIDAMNELQAGQILC